MAKLCKCGDIVDDRCYRCYPVTKHKQTTKERGYGSDWEKVREKKFSLNPLCELCEDRGLVTPTEHVHHIQKIRDRPDLRLDLNNLMSVCIECHAKIEALS